MATSESMAIRANVACDRIESALRDMGVEVAPLPRLMKDREMLRCNQLEQIAALLEQPRITVTPELALTQSRIVAAKEIEQARAAKAGK